MTFCFAFTIADELPKYAPRINRILEKSGVKGRLRENMGDFIIFVTQSFGGAGVSGPYPFFTVGVGFTSPIIEGYSGSLRERNSVLNAIVHEETHVSVQPEGVSGFPSALPQAEHQFTDDAIDLLTVISYQPEAIDPNFLPMNQKAMRRKPMDEWLSVQGFALRNPVWAEAPSVSSGSASQLDVDDEVLYVWHSLVTQAGIDELDAYKMIVKAAASGRGIDEIRSLYDQHRVPSQLSFEELFNPVSRLGDEPNKLTTSYLFEVVDDSSVYNTQYLKDFEQIMRIAKELGD